MNTLPKANKDRMSNLCICGFPTLNPNILGVCDKCGYEFFDTRNYLPLETVTTWKWGEGKRTRISSTKANKEAMAYNERLFKDWLEKHDKILLSTILKAVEPIIGEDEKPDIQLGTNAYIYSAEVEARNKLRASQRQALKEMQDGM